VAALGGKKKKQGRGKGKTRAGRPAEISRLRVLSANILPFFGGTEVERLSPIPEEKKKQTKKKEKKKKKKKGEGGRGKRERWSGPKSPPLFPLLPTKHTFYLRPSKTAKKGGGEKEKRRSNAAISAGRTQLRVARCPFKFGAGPTCTERKKGGKKKKKKGREKKKGKKEGKTPPTRQKEKREGGGKEEELGPWVSAAPAILIPTPRRLGGFYAGQTKRGKKKRKKNGKEPTVPSPWTHLGPGDLV